MKQEHHFQGLVWLVLVLKLTFYQISRLGAQTSMVFGEYENLSKYCRQCNHQRHDESECRLLNKEIAPSKQNPNPKLKPTDQSYRPTTSSRPANQDTTYFDQRKEEQEAGKDSQTSNSTEAQGHIDTNQDKVLQDDSHSGKEGIPSTEISPLSTILPVVLPFPYRS